MDDNQWTCPVQSRVGAWPSDSANVEALSETNLRSATFPSEIPSPHDDLSQVLHMIGNLHSQFIFPIAKVDMADFGVPRYVCCLYVSLYSVIYLKGGGVSGLTLLSLKLKTVSSVM